jgi:hypothetical protein
MAGKAGSLGVALFGSIFLAVGVGAGFYSVRTLLRAEAMRAWREVPAQVTSCELDVARGSKGSRSYEVRATYQYEVDGVRYTGDRVSLHAGHDNIGRFHQRTYAQLRQSREGVEAVSCWVNPDRPAEAILIRTPRLELLAMFQIFALAFGGAGLSVVLAGLSGLFEPSPRLEAAGQSQIRMRGAGAHRAAAVLALAWNGYLGWLLWLARAVSQPEALPWYLWLIGATGLAPLGAAAYLTCRFRKFGVSVLELSPAPGAVGGTVTGAVRLSARVEADKGFDAVLQCVHQFTTRSGKHSQTHRHVLWEEALHLDAAHALGEDARLPVRFSVPEGKPATTAAGGRNGYYWQLTVTAAAPGLDYKAVFDVPMRAPRAQPAG